MLDKTEGRQASVHLENYHEQTNTLDLYFCSPSKGHAVLSGAPHDSKVSSLKFTCKERAKCCKYYNMDS